MVDDVFPVVTHIVNLSIQQATFPSLYKFSKVIPLLKSTSTAMIQMYDSRVKAVDKRELAGVCMLDMSAALLLWTMVFC